jgi:hypothetical protein
MFASSRSVSASEPVVRTISSIEFPASRTQSACRSLIWVDSPAAASCASANWRTNFQHDVPVVSVELHQRLVDQQGHVIEHLPILNYLAIAYDLFGSLQAEPSGEDTQPSKHHLFRFSQKVVTPRQRCLQGLMPFG